MLYDSIGVTEAAVSYAMEREVEDAHVVQVDVADQFAKWGCIV